MQYQFFSICIFLMLHLPCRTKAVYDHSLPHFSVDCIASLPHIVGNV